MRLKVSTVVCSRSVYLTWFLLLVARLVKALVPLKYSNPATRINVFLLVQNDATCRTILLLLLCV